LSGILARIIFLSTKKLLADWQKVCFAPIGDHKIKDYFYGDITNNTKELFNAMLERAKQKNCGLN